MHITLKEKAREMLESKLGPEEFLRVTVVKGGCAGLTYGAAIDRTMKEGEQVILQTGRIRIVSDLDNAQYLDGLTIDFSDELISGGLRFTNTRAKSTCGCGASFNLSGFPVLETGKCGN